MLIWQQNLLKKFEAKFPEYYQGCKDSNWYFLRSSNMCSATNKDLGAVCVFTYENEQVFGLSISNKLRRVKNEK